VSVAFFNPPSFPVRPVVGAKMVSGHEEAVTLRELE
jgi:hypothetical protein